MEEEEDGALPMETALSPQLQVDFAHVASFLHDTPAALLAPSSDGLLREPAIRVLDGYVQPALYLVVDTNFFISQLNVLSNLIAADNISPLRCVLVTPWVVLQELDGLKSATARAPSATSGDESKSVALLARQASHFLHMTLDANRMRVQTIEESKIPFLDWVPESNDDRILHCCMELQRRYHRLGRVVLLSNDLNLRLKAKVHSVSVNKKTIGDLSMEALVQEIVFMYTHAAHPSIALMSVQPEPMQAHEAHALAEDRPAVTEWCICNRISELHKPEDHDQASSADPQASISHCSDIMDET